MKIVFTLIAAFAFTVNAYNQIVTLSNEENVVYGTAANDAEELSVAWSVTNATGNAMDIKCRRIAIAEVEGAYSQFCWGILCSPWNTGNASLNEIVPLNPGETSNSFYAKYRHYGFAGQSIYSYCYFNADDPTQEFCYNVNYCVDAECFVSVAEENKPAGEIENVTPNPISGQGMISYKFNTNPTDASMIIYNMVGAVVKEISLTSKQGAVIIDGSEFESGIYFCAIKNEGNVFETTRIVISH